jgi:hypothetical protein
MQGEEITGWEQAIRALERSTSFPTGGKVIMTRFAHNVLIHHTLGLT